MISDAKENKENNIKELKQKNQTPDKKTLSKNSNDY